jgi:myosin heavy chain 6/7
MKFYDEIKFSQIAK